MLNLTPDDIICRVITLIIALTIHEFAHAFVTDSLGDPTPRAAGYLTLNPLKHLDFFGSMMVLLTGYGWAKPTPIDPYALRQHSKFAIIWVSIAGPISNLILAILAVVPLRFGWVQIVAPTGILPTLGEFLYIFFYINLILAVFNLIPFPPLDGEKVLAALLPEKAVAGYEKFRPYGPFVLMLLIFLGPTLHFDLIGWIMTPILTGLQKVLLGI
ncbi:MAG: site-2 protease family protein [Anaerolineaceae bacterium]